MLCENISIRARPIAKARTQKVIRVSLLLLLCCTCAEDLASWEASGGVAGSMGNSLRPFAGASAPACDMSSGGRCNKRPTVIALLYTLSVAVFAGSAFPGSDAASLGSSWSAGFMYETSCNGEEQGG